METVSTPEMTWKERLADLKYKTAMAHDCVQIEKDMRRQSVVERLIKKTQDGTLQSTTSEPMDKQLEEPMAVRIGDESHVHYHNETKPVVPQPSTTSSIAKTLAAAGLAAAGLGAGAALPIAAYQMFKQAPTNVIVPTDTDTDTNTKYGLRVFRDAEQQQE